MSGWAGGLVRIFGAGFTNNFQTVTDCSTKPASLKTQSTRQDIRLGGSIEWVTETDADSNGCLVL
ncbi:MAG TPA: hypothetical protein DDW76_02775 [Cyanobacteria bacterium UBA11369]|nr:hypothetical protein [Cyanobacteria bacterium UBA11371]HBE34343.1 hypothetical protein [Cyanobacteria bacterium UBA11368]HBE47752.1 hypothetical protein [Cyanobacteria bacterium UBA11369]